MKFSPVLQRFVDKARLPVMMRALLQRELDAVQPATAAVGTQEQNPDAGDEGLVNLPS